MRALIMISSRLEWKDDYLVDENWVRQSGLYLVDKEPLLKYIAKEETFAKSSFLM